MTRCKAYEYLSKMEILIDEFKNLDRIGDDNEAFTKLEYLLFITGKFEKELWADIENY